MVCLTAEFKPNFLCLLYTKHRIFFFFLQKKSFLKKRGIWWRIEGFLTALITASTRKHANDSKDHEKTVMTAIKQGLNPDFNPLYYAIWSVLENKTNATWFA